MSGIKEYRIDYKVLDKPRDVFTYGANRKEAYRNLPTIYKGMATEEDLIKVRDMRCSESCGIEHFLKKPWSGY